MDQPLKFENDIICVESISTDVALCELYNELRSLADSMIRQEPAGLTLQPTALVHEAYLRLIGNADQEYRWENKAHFFGSVSIAMRRILVEAARRRNSMKHGGEMTRRSMAELEKLILNYNVDVLSLDDALKRLEEVEPEAVNLVHLRYFMCMTIDEAAEVLGISPRSADRLWAFAKAWLRDEIKPLTKE